MADAREPELPRATPANSNIPAAHRRPRWLVWGAVVLTVLVLVVVVVAALSGGHHGPGMHQMGSSSRVAMGPTAAL